MKTHERLVIGTLVGFALLLSSLVVSVHAETLGAKIISVQGIVEMQGGSPGRWVSAGAPAMLPPGSVLRTGPKSQAVIELDGSVITLYETSLIRIPAVASQASTGSRPLRHPALDSGRAVFDVTPTPNHVPFSVQTPTIVAGVKGTVFEVVATGTQEAVYVWRGLVEVSSRINPDDVELVSAGQFTALDQLRLTAPSEIPFVREMPPGLEKHPDTGHDRAHQVTASAPALSGILPTPANPDTLPSDDHAAAGQIPDTATVDALKAKSERTTKFWDVADHMVVESALNRALDIQPVVSSTSLGVPSASGSGTTGTDTSITSTVDTSTVSSDTLSNVVSAVTAPLGGLGF